MIISMNKSSLLTKRDSLPGDLSRDGNDHFFQVLYGIDSLQDSLRVKEIDSAYRVALHEEKLEIPFTITRLTYEKRSLGRSLIR
jgi:hypothetical protein